MKNFLNKYVYVTLALLFVFFLPTFIVHSETINIDAGKFIPRAEVFLSPRSGSFEEGSTFEVPILINTKNRSVNGIEIRLNFDKDKLAIVNPTGGKSIIGLWVEPPVFDNTHGMASYVGVVPNGITTASGLIGVITFKAKAVGNTFVSISSTSKILLNDGLGTLVQTDFGRGDYVIFPKLPEGVNIFSETHPNQQDWYNNNNPVVSWIKEKGVGGFSLELDNNPKTIPDNIIDLNADENTKSFEKLKDGLWYFHIKALKNNSWGSTGNFLLRIDTTSPLKFKPYVNFLTATAVNSDRVLISFSTTDELSGVDHYEVGVIDKNESTTVSPVFVQSDTPFQLPVNENTRLHVIVRAIDKAGNIREAFVEVQQFFGFKKFLKEYPIYILLGIFILGIFLFVMHFFIAHHLWRHLRRIVNFIRREK